MSASPDDEGVDQTSEPPGPADMALPDLPPLPDDAPLPEEPPDDDHHGPRAWSADRGSRSANRSSGARVPPHNLDAEASLLGAMLLSRDAIADALEVVNAEHFYKPSHGHVFEAICGLYASGEPADPVTVAEALARSGLLDQIGGPGLLLELQASTPATSSASKYARIIQEHATLRGLIGAANEIAEIGYGRPDDVVKAVDEAETLVFQVSQGRVTDSMTQIRNLIDANMDRLEHVAVRGLVEVLGVDDLQRVGNGVARQQHGAEERGLGVEVVRRDPCTRRTVGRTRTPVGRPRSRTVVVVVPWFLGKRGIFRERREVGKGHVRRTGWFARLVHGLVVGRRAHVGPPVFRPPMGPRMHGLSCGVLEGKLRLMVPSTPLQQGISRPILWIADRSVRAWGLRTFHDTTGIRPQPVPRRSPARRPRHGVR